jgi:hypothetical protein
MITGKAEITIENQHYELLPDSLFYCCADSLYTFASDGMEYLCLNFDLTQADNTYTGLYPIQHIPDNTSVPTVKQGALSNSDFVHSHLYLSKASEYRDYLQQILEEFSTQKIYYSLWLKLIGAAIYYV